MRKIIPVALFLAAFTSLQFFTPASAAISKCSWDSASGWVARENALPGYQGWAKGIRLVKKIINARVREETRINVSSAPEKIVYSEWLGYFDFIPDELTPPWYPGIPLETQSALQAVTGEILIKAA